MLEQIIHFNIGLLFLDKYLIICVLNIYIYIYKQAIGNNLI